MIKKLKQELMQVLRHLEISNDDLRNILLDEEIAYISNLQEGFDQSDELKIVDKEVKSKSTAEDNDLNKDVEE